MEDREIVALFLRREETALAEAGKKIWKGPLCRGPSGFFAIGRTAGRSWATLCWMLGTLFRRFCRPLRPVGSGLSNGKKQTSPPGSADTACRIKFPRIADWFGLCRTALLIPIKNGIAEATPFSEKNFMRTSMQSFFDKAETSTTLPGVTGAFPSPGGKPHCSGRAFSTEILPPAGRRTGAGRSLQTGFFRIPGRKRSGP